MKLPDNAIGISDIEKWRECPRKMQYQMRRFTEGAQPPEDNNPRTLYGTIFHEVVTTVEDRDLSDEEALQDAFDRFGGNLEPEDMERLKLDLQTYRERDYVGVRTVANETEVRVPLLEWEGETIYFRGKLDRLYQRLDNEGTFIAVDYKTSRWQKSEEEVHASTQMWAYNWLIHENWPECENLVQVYDQLRYGTIPTRKSEAQREQIREWLVRQVTAILKDEEAEPRFNRWCAYCPIRFDCPIIDRLSNFEVAAINEITPDEPVDEQRLDEYVERLDDVNSAIKTLESYVDRVKATIRELPAERQQQLGFKMSGRSFDVWDADALEAAHEALGEDFYRLVKLTKSSVTRFLGDDDPRLGQVLDLARREQGASHLRHVRRS